MFVMGYDTPFKSFFHLVLCFYITSPPPNYRKMSTSPLQSGDSQPTFREKQHAVFPQYKQNWSTPESGLVHLSVILMATVFET